MKRGRPYLAEPVYGLAVIGQLRRELSCELFGHRGEIVCRRCSAVLVEPAVLVAMFNVGRQLATAFNRMTRSAAEAGRAMGEAMAALQRAEEG